MHFFDKYLHVNGANQKFNTPIYRERFWDKVVVVPLCQKVSNERCQHKSHCRQSVIAHIGGTCPVPLTQVVNQGSKIKFDVSAFEAIKTNGEDQEEEAIDAALKGFAEVFVMCLSGRKERTLWIKHGLPLMASAAFFRDAASLGKSVVNPVGGGPDRFKKGVASLYAHFGTNKTVSHVIPSIPREALTRLFMGKIICLEVFGGREKELAFLCEHVATEKTVVPDGQDKAKCIIEKYSTSISSTKDTYTTGCISHYAGIASQLGNERLADARRHAPDGDEAGRLILGFPPVSRADLQPSNTRRNRRRRGTSVALPPPQPMPIYGLEDITNATFAV